MEWWAISEASSSDPNGSWLVIQGTTSAIKAKYDGAAYGPFSTQAAAQAYANKGGPGPAIPGNPGSAIKKGLGDAVSGLSNSVLGPLFQANIWIRVGEVLLGIVLVAVGIARMTNAVPIATKIAGVAAKGALL